MRETRQDQQPGEVERRLADLEAFARRVLRNDWISAPLRPDGFPALPVVDALPTASAARAYQLVTLRGVVSSTADISYQCLRTSAGVWGWRVVATG